LRTADQTSATAKTAPQTSSSMPSASRDCGVRARIETATKTRPASAAAAPAAATNSSCQLSTS
jgi:hypothetical protein